MKAARIWFPIFMAEPSASAIITAAGLGKRFGEGLPKQFMPLSGKPVLIHSIEAFSKSPLVEDITLVVPERWVEYTRREIVGRLETDKVGNVIAGGAERQDSVANGFQSLNGTPDIVVVHDGVRPFVSVEIIEEVINAASECGAAIAALPSHDTVKKSSPAQYIESTLPRDSLWFAQTPQAFRHEILRRAFIKASEDGFTGTDESLLVERTGVDVKLVTGSPYNIKITTEEDLLLGELIVKEGIHKKQE
ncbi:MAG: 2-C-methyl-D-erythritol 4-phosphate cytidylyltransferase [Deltaproteobacteria bacterium]